MKLQGRTVYQGPRGGEGAFDGLSGLDSVTR